MGTLEDVTRAIAGNVRSERAVRGWTLDELAERAGVSRRLIVQVEQGQTICTCVGFIVRNRASARA